MSEVGDILADAEVERLIADRANLLFQRNAVQARIDEIGRHLAALRDVALRERTLGLPEGGL